MTRFELQRLRDIANALPTRPEIAALQLHRVISDAEAEHDAEDAHHDQAESDAYPTNLEHAA